MEVLHQPGDCQPPEGGSVVTIGAYDGLHLGHRQVIGQVRALAASMGAVSTVVTFDHHPAEVVRPSSAPALLTDLDQKLSLLESTGVDRAVVVHFDEGRSQETPEEFVREVLVGCLAARAVVVGSDFHFGHQRRGDVTLLRRLGKELGFEVVGVDLVPVSPGGMVISSTRVRQALAAGEVEEAAALLGRPHQVRGLVEHGDQRGRTLGYPTANVAVPAYIALPGDGVYAGWYERPDGSRWPAAVSLGRRPTFYEDADLSLLEAYLLDFTGDLYDETARVEFVARLRGQLKFSSAQELVDQMGLDVAAARRILAR